MEKRKKPSPRPVATRPAQDIAPDDTLTIVGTGVLHVETRNALRAAPSYRTPIGCCSGERFWPGSTGIPPAE
jgi:hypothetical protein